MQAPPNGDSSDPPFAAAARQPRRPIKVLSQALPHSSFRVLLPVFPASDLRRHGRHQNDHGGRLRLPWEAVSPALMQRRTTRRGALRSLRGRSARTCMRFALLPAFCVCFVCPNLSSVATIGHTADAVTLSACSRFSEVTLGEVRGNNPPRAFRNMGTAEREQLFWALKAQTTAQRGQDLLRQQAPPVRFGPNRGQTEQPRQGRRARVLSAEQRRERLAQEGQSSMDIGGGEVSKPLFCPKSPNRSVFRRHTYSHLRAIHLRPRSRRILQHPRLRRLHSLPPHGLASRHQPHRSRLLQCRRRPHSRLLP